MSEELCGDDAVDEVKRNKGNMDKFGFGMPSETICQSPSVYFSLYCVATFCFS
jgi:hypothetical protein